MSRKGRNNDVYGVVGVGRFGLAVAQTLLELGKDVIALDINPQRLRPLENTAADVLVIEEISMEAFEDAGLRGCRCIVIGVGKDIEASILAALNAKELGVERVICKVINKEHAKILEKIGVEVIFPELETGARLAVKLVSNLTEDIFAVSNKFSIIQMRVPQSYDGRSVLDANLRKRFGVNIIALVHGGSVNGQIGPDTVMHADDDIVIAGYNDMLDRLQEEFQR